MVALALAFSASSNAACLSASAVAELEERLASAEKAYIDLDAAGFGRALDDARLLLPCLGDVASPAIAAHYHRLEGVRLYAAGQQDQALAAMRAARVLDPGYRFPDELLPPDHALRQAFEALDPSEGRTDRPPQPRDGELAFDGTRTPRRPLDRATLVQLVDPAGSVSQTAWLAPGAPLPAYRARPRTRDRLLLASSALLAASAGFYGWAWTTHAPFADPSVTDLAELETLQAESRGLTAASGATLGLGLTGVAVAFALGADGR
jgi:hypothetical protein